MGRKAPLTREYYREYHRKWRKARPKKLQEEKEKFEARQKELEKLANIWGTYKELLADSENIRRGNFARAYVP
ncbi:hypothetical protein UFOVP434_25 [uncultured Caudovirales phage]|uniref:Uncharacterized protein n=1 Tax=uncultured Caudovirales phage TaxID=2100421 RepID=A0A6J5MBD6_9CAUD|nr:hypothetical protein UFOVP434_25 [uncultured Caudovirales phage]